MPITGFSLPPDPQFINEESPSTVNYPNQMTLGRYPAANESLFYNNPADYLPKNLVNTRKVTIGMPLKIGATDKPNEVTNPNNLKEGTNWQGLYGRDLHNKTTDDQKYNNILISKIAGDGYGSTLGHELGHAAWRLDIDKEAKDTWNRLHQNRLNTYRYGGYIDTTGFLNDDSIPPAIRFYKDDPSHSFAEMFGEYIGSPQAFKTRWPAEYNYFKTRVFNNIEYDRHEN